MKKLLVSSACCLIIVVASFGLLSSCSSDEAAPIPVTVDTLAPDSGPYNTLVSITGSGFNTVLTENKVSVNGKPAIVKGATLTELVIEIPKGAGTGTVSVTVRNQTAVGPDFEYVLTPIITNLAGKLNVGNTDGIGDAAGFYNPWGIILDSQGMLYVCDATNNRIRKITKEGVVTTLAGSTVGFAEGTGSLAKFDQPTGLTIDNADNLLICDVQNKRIRKVTKEGIVSTFAGSGFSGTTDGNASSAKFSKVMGVAVDGDGNTFVADATNNRIRKITSSGIVSTFAGNISGSSDGIGSQASFKFPTAIAIDSKNNLYIADRDNHRIRKITSDAAVSTLAGSVAGFSDGTGGVAKFSYPSGLAVDKSDNLYVADYGNYAVRKITPDGVVTTLVADDDALITPTGIVIDDDGTIYVTEVEGHRIRKIILE